MIISWNTTKLCNLKCEHCYRDAGKKDPLELTTEEGMALLDGISEAGFKIIIFSGGEPLMRQDIFDLIAHAKSIGLRPVLGSNGTLFTQEIVRKLISSGIVRSGISLDSKNALSHDAFRRQDGAWQATINAMRICADEGLDFQVHTTVTKRNFNEITDITDFVIGLGAKAHHIFFLVPTGRGKDIESVFISVQDIRQVLEKVLRKQKECAIELKPVCAPQFVPLSRKMGIDLRFGRGCLAGVAYCCILPDGDVHPCPYLPLRVGNVRETPFSRIWKDNAVFTKLRTLAYSGACGPCANKESCGGCRARAYYASGDYMAQDPDCALCASTVKYAR